MFGCTFPLAAAAQSRAHRPSDMSRTTKCRGRCAEPYLRSAICALPLRFACLPAIGNQVTPTPFRAPTILRRRPGTDSNETLAASRPFDVPPARQPVTPRAAARRGPTALRLKTIAKACSSRARAKPHRATAMSPPHLSAPKPGRSGARQGCGCGRASAPRRLMQPRASALFEAYLRSHVYSKTSI